MRRNQAGFTLIELVMVIVILGILSVVALPKYMDMRTDAAKAAAQGLAATLSSASATNFASRQINLGGQQANGTVAINNCNQAWTLLATGQPSAAQAHGTYAILAVAAAVGTPQACTLNFTPTGGILFGTPFTVIGTN